MRACQPIRDGYVERDGVKIFYEVFGAGEPTVLLLPTWSTRCTPGTGRCRSRTSRGIAVWSRSTDAAMAVPTGRRQPRRTRRPSSRPMRSR